MSTSWDEKGPIGRALVAAFDLNSARRHQIRRAEELFGLFPPPEKEH